MSVFHIPSNSGLGEFLMWIEQLLHKDRKEDKWSITGNYIVDKNFIVICFTFLS